MVLYAYESDEQRNVTRYTCLCNFLLLLYTTDHALPCSADICDRLSLCLFFWSQKERRKEGERIVFPRISATTSMTHENGTLHRGCVCHWRLQPISWCWYCVIVDRSTIDSFSQWMINVRELTHWMSGAETKNILKRLNRARLFLLDRLRWASVYIGLRTFVCCTAKNRLVSHRSILTSHGRSQCLMVTPSLHVSPAKIPMRWVASKGVADGLLLVTKHVLYRLGLQTKFGHRGRIELSQLSKCVGLL